MVQRPWNMNQRLSDSIVQMHKFLSSIMSDGDDLSVPRPIDMTYRFLASESASAFSLLVRERYPDLEVVASGLECKVCWRAVPDAKAIAELDRSLCDISLELCGRSESNISIISVTGDPSRK